MTTGGGVAVTATVFAPTRAVVAVLDSDGAARFVKYGGEETSSRGVAAVGDGGVVVALDLLDASRHQTSFLIRYDDVGAEAWVAEVPGTGPQVAFGLFRTPDGVAIGQALFAPSFAIQVDRFGEDGSYLGRTRTTGTGGCHASYSSGIVADVDGRGTVFVGTRQSDGPLSCARTTVLRFGPGGAGEATYGVEFSDLPPFATDAHEDGGVAFAYAGPGGPRLARASAEGDVLADIPLAATGPITGVAAGPGVSAFAVGFDISPDAGALPFAVSVGDDGTPQRAMLPRLGGLATEAGVVVLGVDGAGYVVLNAQANGARPAAVARVEDAVPVSAERSRSQARTLVSALGPNPVRSGASVRARLRAPVRVTLYDALGRQIMVRSETVGEVEITMPNVAGVYALRVEGPHHSVTYPIVVVR
ncbi:T9SS type A sorting domain-containing protein [Rubrivirga sp.]|uniref:T9SS type A sorting domain-containing protein n=1 Tax=Rubrivirga sp. TaxID=1885344 RepID=UPI003B521A9D